MWKTQALQPWPARDPFRSAPPLQLAVLLGRQPVRATETAAALLAALPACSLCFMAAGTSYNAIRPRELEVERRAHRGVKVWSAQGCFSESGFEGSELPGTRSEVNAI